MQMRDIEAQLETPEDYMSQRFVMYYISNILSQQHGPSKKSYNIYDDKWSNNELMIMCL